MTNVTRAQYDRLWTGTWGDLQRFGPVHRRQREAVLHLIQKFEPKTVLDIGCGSGDNLAWLARTNPSLALAGADVSLEAIGLAKQCVPNATFWELDVQSTSLSDRFDLVMAIQVIEHLADDVSALRNMALMAKRWVLVTTMRGRMRPSERAIGHYRNYSNSELVTKADQAGLDVIDLFGWGFPFYSPFYRTIAEWLPSGPPAGTFGAMQKTIANLIYYLYALNVPKFGDVVTMLARPRTSSQ